MTVETVETVEPQPTWGERRDRVKEVLNDVLMVLPPDNLAARALVKEACEELNAMRPNRQRQGPRRFRKLNPIQQAQAIHMHQDGRNDGEIALALQSSSGNVSNFLGPWSRGELEREPYWPDVVDDSPYCICAIHSAVAR